MALTTASRFLYVSVAYSVGRIPASIGYRTTDDSRGYILLYPWPAAGSASLAELVILQEIWASSDGFLDADGNAIIVGIGEHPIPDHSVPIEDYAGIGLINPLDPNSYPNSIDLSKVQGAFAQHGSVEEDAISSSKDIVLTGGFKTKKGTPLSGSVEVGIRGWSVRSGGTAASGDENIVFTYVSDADSGYAAFDDFFADPEFLVFLQWLQGNKHAGVDLWTGSLDDVNNLSLVSFSGSETSGVRFRVNQAPSGETADNITFFLGATSYGNGHVTFQGEVYEGTLDTLELNVRLHETVETIVTTKAAVRPPIQAPDFVADRVQFPGFDVVSRLERPSLRMPSGFLTIGKPYGRIIKADQLHETGSYSWLDFTKQEYEYNVTQIHLAGSGAVNETFRLDSVPAMCLEPGQSRDLDIRNDDPIGVSTSTIKHVQKEDGTEILQLDPGETLPLRINWDPGDKREILSRRSIVRTYELVGTQCGNLATNQYLNDPDGLSSLKVRPWQIPATRSIDRFHADTFERSGSGTWIANALITPGWYPPEAVKLLKSGRLRLEFATIIAPASSGVMTNGNNLIFILNGERVGPAFYQKAWEAGGPSQTMHAVIEFQVSAGDIIVPLLRYKTSGISMSFSTVNVDYYRLRLDLDYKLAA